MYMYIKLLLQTLGLALNSGTYIRKQKEGGGGGVALLFTFKQPLQLMCVQLHIHLAPQWPHESANVD